MIKEQNIIHHYIITIKCHSIFSQQAGQFFMKYKPIHWTTKDRDNLFDAIQLSKDKLFPSGVEINESLEIYNCQELVHNLNGLRLAACANECSIHHFNSEYEIEEEWFDMIVKNYKYNKKLLKNSRINL